MGSPRALPRGNAVTAVTSADQGENVCAFSYGQPRLHEAVLCQLPLAAGLVAKENIVGTLGILYGGGELTAYQALGQAFNGISGYSFLVFNLLCAPCFAAIGAIKREMNNAKWTWFAIGYQCCFAYVIALMINQFGGAFTGSLNVLGLIVAIALLVGIVYMLFKPYKEATKLKTR